MGIEIDWTYNKAKIRAYMKIKSVGTQKGNNGNAPTFTRGGSMYSHPPDDFFNAIHYEIYDKKGGNLISQGLYKAKYDLESKENVIAHAYGRLKVEHADVKEANAKDV